MDLLCVRNAIAMQSCLMDSHHLACVLRQAHVIYTLTVLLGPVFAPSHSATMAFFLPLPIKHTASFPFLLLHGVVFP